MRYAPSATAGDCRRRVSDSGVAVAHSSCGFRRGTDSKGEGNAACASPLDLEVAQVLRRFVRRREVSSERCWTALQDLVTFPLIRHPHGFLLDRIWELRDSFTAYDAAYVALAEALDAPLVTRDKRLLAARGHSARIEVVYARPGLAAL